MDDLGAQIAWRGLAEGTPVYDNERKQIGVVEHVQAPADIFEGIVIHTRPLPGRHLFARYEQIAEIHERGVLLSVGRDELSEPEENPRRPAGQGSLEPGWQARLRRAWDWLVGQR